MFGIPPVEATVKAEDDHHAANAMTKDGCVFVTVGNIGVGSTH